MKSQKNNLCNNSRRWSDNLSNYCSLHHRHHYCYFLMNYTLQQLKDRVNTLIEQQGPEAYCGAWIYTAEDCRIEDEYPAIEDSELAERIFNDVGNIDYIYTVIQECVDEVTEEQWMQYQQELQEAV